MLQNSILNFSKKHTLISPQSKIVVGLSGGPDSVFLLLFLKDLVCNGMIESVYAAHLDHQWRSGSEKDVLFCRALAQKLSIPFFTDTLDSYRPLLKDRGSKEALGRDARRLFLESIRKEVGGTAIALAHHLQDQEETFFIRLLRGSSLTGLTCMKPRSGMFIRPLLETNKDEIVAFLTKNNVQYLIDPSNESPQFLRNRIRSNVIPALEKVDNRFSINFLSTLHHLQATEDFLEKLTHASFEQLRTSSNAHEGIAIALFNDLDLLLKKRVLLFWLIKEQASFSPSDSFLEEIIRFLDNPRGGSHILSSEWHLTKIKGVAFIEKMS